MRGLLSFALIFSLSALQLFAQTAPPLRVLPAYGEPEYNAGSVPGNNQQYMTGFAYSESDPSRLYMSQDVGGVWVSRDAGRNWNTLKNMGLHSRFTTAIEVDPLDRNRLFVIGSCESWDALHRNYQGIYRSVNGGIDWTRVAARTEIGFIRRTTHLITYAPSSKNTTLGYATRWYAAISEFNGSAAIESDDGFLYSDDGGDTWTETRKLDKATFGEHIFGARVHPLNQDIVFLYGSEGLIRFDDAANPTGAYTRLSGSGGLPGGTIGSDIYISPDADTLIAGVQGQGIYKSVDGGANWSQVYAYTGLVKCFVNPAHPDVMFATASSSGGQVRVSKDGGLTWNTSVSVTPVPGFSGNWNTRIYGSFACIVPDPRDPDRAFAQGNAMFFQTDNGGDKWYPSNGYFNGNQTAGNFEQMFDPVNPDRFVYFMVDVGVRATTNRGKWFTKDANMSSFVTAKTCRAGAVHPVASTGIVLACVQSATGQLLRSADNGVNWTQVRPATKKRWFIFFDQQNPDYCYQWQERSDDAGVTWTQLTIPGATDPVICGMSYQDGRVIYALDVTSPNNKVYRSDDRGDTWQLAFTSPARIKSPLDQSFNFRVHPANHNIVFTSGVNGTLTRWDLTNPAAPVSTDIQPVLTPTETGFYVSRLAIDRRFPSVMYITNMRQGTPNQLFRTQDGGSTWENISDLHPCTNIGSIEVSPITGEVFISNTNTGVHVLPPPYPTTEAGKAKMAYYTTAWSDNYIDQPYHASVGAQTPYGGTATSLPGILPAGNYDEGGEGAAFHDDSFKTGDVNYRPDDAVDVEADAPASSGYRIMNTARGEWLAYTVDVSPGPSARAAAATVDMELIYSSVAETPGALRVTLDDEVLGTFTDLTSTGSLSTYGSSVIRDISLPEGNGQIIRLEFLEGGQFNVDAVNFSSTALPVRLAHFKLEKLAEAGKNSTLLKWAASEELSGSHFEIERSPDAVAWALIGKLTMANNGNELTSYSFIDYNPLPARNYYRLKTVDRDGSYNYSSIRFLEFPKADPGLVVYPVPSSDFLKIKGLEELSIKNIYIVDINGKTVYNGYSVGSDGIRLESLQPGIYYLKAEDKSGLVSSYKFVIQK